MMRIGDRLKLIALFAHPTHDVSGGLHAFDEFADSLRLFAPFVHPTPENGGASQAACMPMIRPC